VTAYTPEQLQAAYKALSSSVRKIEKATLTLSAKQPPPKAQLTLASRNLAALRIALELIGREMKDNI